MHGHPDRRRLFLAFTGVLAAGLIGLTLTTAFDWIHKPFAGFFLHENLTVAPYFVPGWTGRAAGLEPLDRIEAVNGIRVSERRTIHDLIGREPAGTAFRYRVIRGGAPLELTIASMQLSVNGWLLAFGVFVAVGTAFLIIGSAPYYHRAASPAALPLCLMGVAVFVWFGTTFDFLTAGIIPRYFRFFGLAMTPTTAIHMALTLRTGNPLRRSHWWALSGIYGFGAAVGALSGLTVFSQNGTWDLIFRAGYIYLCLGAVVFLLIVGDGVRAARTDLERSRLRVMLAGAFLGFLLPTSGAVLTSSFHWAIPYNVALIPAVFFPLSVAYALLKYSLFDLGNVLKVALTRIVLTGVLLALYGAVAVSLMPWAGARGGDPLIPLFFSVLVVVFFNPLLRKVERLVAIYIYGQTYDTGVVQRRISLFLRSLSMPAVLSQGFLERIVHALGIGGAVLAYRAAGSNAYVTARVGIEQPDDSSADAAIRLLAGRTDVKRHGAVWRSEVVNSPEFGASRSSFLEIFDRWRAALLIPVVFEREVRGFVAFGAKRSGGEYSADDLRLLSNLTDQLALSLENGRLFADSERSKEEYRRLYCEADLAKQRLIENDRIKKHFVANICHELRTPLSAMIGYSEVLLDPSFRGDARAILEKLADNGQGLSLVMDNLMNFSRMETDGIFTRFESVDLAEMIGALETMSTRIIRNRPIDFRVISATEIRHLHTDPNKLQQILVNLLTNAFKFTERGRIQVAVEDVFEADRPFLEIAVSDTGIGIKQEDLNLIFEDFRQLDGSSSRQYGGTGVGLSVCRRMAESIGGSLRVESEFGAGSRFSLLLPMTAPDALAGVSSRGSEAAQPAL